MSLSVLAVACGGLLAPALEVEPQILEQRSVAACKHPGRGEEGLQILGPAEETTLDHLEDVFACVILPPIMAIIH